MAVLNKKELEAIKASLVGRLELRNLILIEGEDAKTVKDLVETVEFLQNGIGKTIKLLEVVNCGGNTKVAMNDLRKLIE